MNHRLWMKWTVAAAAALAASSAYATEAVVSGDTYVSSSYPANNFGYQSNLHVDPTVDGVDCLRSLFGAVRDSVEPNQQSDAVALCQPDQQLGRGQPEAGYEHVERAGRNLQHDSCSGISDGHVYAGCSAAVRGRGRHLTGAGLGIDALE